MLANPFFDVLLLLVLHLLAVVVLRFHYSVIPLTEAVSVLVVVAVAAAADKACIF